MTSVLLRCTTKNIVRESGIRFYRHLRRIPQENLLIPAGFNAAAEMCNTKMAVVNNVNYSNQSNNNLSSWKRPEGPPRIWKTFEGRKPSKDGKIPRFSIQDVPEERVEDVVEFMLKYFPVEEGLCIALGLAKNPVAMEDFRTYWRKIVGQGMSVVVFTESSDANKKPLIVGASPLTVVTRQNKATTRNLDQFKSKEAKIFYGIVFGVEDEADILTKYNVDKYLGSAGVVADHDFRGNGIGEKLLKVREDIGRAYQMSVTQTMFTMKSSQISASRAGFEVLLQKNYSELLDYEGNLAFPGTTGSFIQLMGKKLY